MSVINTSGRRKTSIARIYLKKGSGNVMVNNKNYKEYFPSPLLQFKIEQPFHLTSNDLLQYDVKINVKGGGITGQAEAIRLAISKAFVSINEEYKSMLRPFGLLTRDPRMVERKKYGQKKARKKFQFSKR